MPPLTTAVLRKQIASGDTAPLYMLVGDSAFWLPEHILSKIEPDKLESHEFTRRPILSGPRTGDDSEETESPIPRRHAQDPPLAAARCLPSKESFMRRAHVISSVAVVAATVLSGCRTEQQSHRVRQVVLREGSPLTFTTNEAAVRL